ncbi:MAG: hypothetical protein LBB72_08610 [Spirochaetaceae bacterium]|jgi:hypothetical protein|nr:hypothetical protein [Spirochaetaceae bacterium]
MKKNKLRIFTVLIVLTAAMLVTCVDQTVSYTSEALLISLKIGDEVATVSNPITGIQWDSETYSLAGADRGRVAFNNEEAATNQRVRAVVNPGSRIEWGMGKLGVRPDYFYDPRVPIPLIDDGDHIYIRVTADDNETINYYRVFARYKYTVASLNSISIQTRVGKMEQEDVEGGDIPENATGSKISITIGEAAAALVEAVTFDENATTKYAVVGEDADPPLPENFTAADVPLVIPDQGWLYVEVTAENTVAKSYFKFKADVGRLADIGTLTFKAGNAANQQFIIYGKGLPNADYSKVGSGDYSTADQPNDGFAFEIMPEDSEATVTYAKVPTSSNTTPVFDTPEKLVFTDGEFLAIKVEAVNGGVVLYYKIKVSIVPANVKSHPKSAWYKRGAVAAPLTVELDRAGSFTYQWYESDSWYGIYGRHGTALDEKNNISYVNGGPDMYYYLAQPDGLASYNMRQPAGADEPIAWKIDGATGTSYTPPTDWENVPVEVERDGGINNVFPYKPNLPSYPGGGGPKKVNFITGSTSESRYYWCVATAPDGRTVISKRALILTETNNKMDHFIFELSDLPAKNIIPFTVKQGDPYRIQFPANYFPAGFDPRKYEICVAIAQFFLPDGRPWTQNWTHGDLHFGYDDNSLTWWHNNLGANSGSIPLHAPHSSRGGLERKPDWVGFTPSGNPGLGLPPLDSATGELPRGYKPAGYTTGIAQGYFCGFIELLELRFSTAPTN